MKKNRSVKRGPQDSNMPSAQPDKVGWIRKFCGRGIFREIWKNRFVVLKGEQLYISDKEVKDEKKIQEVFDLADYERSEELRKGKSRTKKNHSKFTLLRCRQPGNSVPNLVFLAVSPEEKESWINALNGAITRAKNSVLDEVTVEEEHLLVHPTRDRAKIPHTRRLPTRGHLMAVASTSTSDGMLTLDLIQEEDSSSTEQHNLCQKSLRAELGKSAPQLDSDSCGAKPQPSGETVSKSTSLPQKIEVSWDRPTMKSQAHTPQPGKRLSTAEKSRCVSTEAILSHSEAKRSHTGPVDQLHHLISHKLERTQELLAKAKGPERNGSDPERLLREATTMWSQARDVLEELKAIQVLCRQLDSNSSPVTTQCSNLRSPQQTQSRKSMM